MELGGFRDADRQAGRITVFRSLPEHKRSPTSFCVMFFEQFIVRALIFLRLHGQFFPGARLSRFMFQNRKGINILVVFM
jgi:hypothetical protein